MSIKQIFTGDLGCYFATKIIQIFFNKYLYKVGLFMLFWGATTFLFSADYYLSPNGDDGASGDINNPWATISKANVTLTAGDTVFFRAGTYQDVIYPANSGTSTAKITYKGYQDEEVLITGTPNQPGVVFLGYNCNNSDWTAKSYIVIENLKIKNNYLPTTANCENIMIYGTNTHDIEIRNIEIVRNDSETEIFNSWVAGHRETGIVISKAYNNVVENCTISGLTKIGLKISSCANNNIIFNNDIAYTFNNCIDIGDGDYTFQGNLIEDNILSDSLTSDGIQFEPDYDLNPEEDDSSNQGVVIRNNIICYNAENALDLKGTCRIVIEDNLIFGNYGNNNGYVNVLTYDSSNNMTYNDELGGPGITHGANTKSKDIIIRNNFIYDNSSGIQVDKGYKVYNNVILNNARNYAGSNSTNSRNDKPLYTGPVIVKSLAGTNDACIKNNIIGDHPISEILFNSTLTHNLDINNNIYYNFDQVVFGDSYASNDWNALSFSQWQSFLEGITGINGCEENSSVVNGPDNIFINGSSRPVDEIQSYNYSPKLLSAAIDEGTFLTFTNGSGSGSTISLEDAGYFYDGFGITDGDTIQLEGQLKAARITAVDYTNNTITVDQTLTWSDNQGISLAYNGSNPDVGCYEYDKTLLYLKFDETAGTDAIDFSGKSNDGILNMGSSGYRVAGKIGGGIHFDGSSDYVAIAASPNLDVTDAISISAWVNVDATGTIMQIVSKYWGTYSMGLHSNGKFMVSYRNQDSTPNTIYGMTTAQTGVWYHVTGVIDSNSDVELYVNGNLEASQAFSGTSIQSQSNRQVSIGCGGNCNSYYFDGIIDDVRIYNHALASDEVNSLAMILHLKMDELSGLKANDSSIYNNDGVLNMSSVNYWVTGKTGNAIHFNGSSDYVSATSSPSLDVTDAVSISAWVNIDSTGSIMQIVSKYWGTYSIGVHNNGKFRVSYRNQDSTLNTIYGTTTAQTGVWYHVTGVIDSGGDVELYVNGNLEASQVFSGTSIQSQSNRQVSIGCGGNCNDYYFDGTIDELRIYPRILTSTEVSALYSQ